MWAVCSPYNRPSQVFQAIRNGENEKVREFFEFQASFDNFSIAEEEAAIFMCVKMNNVEICEYGCCYLI